MIQNTIFTDSLILKCNFTLIFKNSRDDCGVPQSFVLSDNLFAKKEIVSCSNNSLIFIGTLIMPTIPTYYSDKKFFMNLVSAVDTTDKALENIRLKSAIDMQYQL